MRMKFRRGKDKPRMEGKPPIINQNLGSRRCSLSRRTALVGDFLPIDSIETSSSKVLSLRFVFSLMYLARTMSRFAYSISIPSMDTTVKAMVRGKLMQYLMYAAVSS